MVLDQLVVGLLVTVPVALFLVSLAVYTEDYFDPRYIVEDDD